MRLLLSFSVLFVCSQLLAQPAQPMNPGPDDIFHPAELATIRLTLSAEDKAFLLDPANQLSDEYKEAVFQMSNSKMDTTLPKKVGLRLRGATSRYKIKKAFKIDFREFNGKKFYGYKKINLKSNVNDPSQVREPLTLQYFRMMGVPAARTSPTKLYMNDEYMGTYLIVEQIDDEFLEARYGHDEGFLYKCTYPANLVDDGQIYDESRYESELDEDFDTRSELANFVSVLNHAEEANFKTAIEEVFNVDLYLRELAVEAMMGHWDGYTFNMNNYYLFYNEETGQVEFFPYDTDNTWGIDFGSGFNWGTYDVNNWIRAGEPRPLSTRILAVTEYREKYVEYLKELIDQYFKDDVLNPIIASYKTILDPAVKDDPYFSADFGYSHDDFLNSFTEPVSDHDHYGITGYLHTRAESAKEQLGLVTETIKKKAPDRIYPNPSINPQTYFYSETGIPSTPAVYNSIGVQIPVFAQTIDDAHTEISLPPNSPSGIYVIHVNKEVYKWIYQK